IGLLDPLERFLFRVVGSLELGTIFRRVAVRPDAEVTGLFRAWPDREHLHRAARSFRKRLLDDLGDNGNKAEPDQQPVRPYRNADIEWIEDELDACDNEENPQHQRQEGCSPPE